MIMFRVKVSPQVVITVQSTLPKLVLTIILVTFSYAIAGFLVDLMYVVIGLIALIFQGFLNFDATRIFYFLTTGWSADIRPGIPFLIAIYLFLLTIISAIVLLFSIGGLASVFLASMALTSIALFTGLTAGGFLIALLILVLLILITMIIMFYYIAIKTIWMLLKAYANILLLTVLAPLQLTFGALVPSFGFGAWLRAFVSNLGVFVTTGFFLVLSFYFLFLALGASLRSVLGESASLDVPRLLSVAFFGTNLTEQLRGEAVVGWPPLLGVGGGYTAIAFLFLGVSFVIFTLIPHAGNIIKSMIEGKPFTYGEAIGEATSPYKTVFGLTRDTLGTRIAGLSGSQTGWKASLLKYLGKSLSREKTIVIERSNPG